MRDGQGLHAPEVDPRQARIDEQVTVAGLLVADEDVEQRRVDVARAQHDAVDVGPGEHVVGVGVVAQPQVRPAGHPGLASRADHPDDPDAGLGVGLEQLGERHRPPIGPDDHDGAHEAVGRALGRQPGPVHRAPGDDRQPRRDAAEEDLLDVEVQLEEAVEHDRPEPHHDHGAGDPRQLDGPDGVEPADPETLAADHEHAEDGHDDHLPEELEPRRRTGCRNGADHEVEAEQDGERVADREDHLQPVDPAVAVHRWSPVTSRRPGAAPPAVPTRSPGAPAEAPG